MYTDITGYMPEWLKITIVVAVAVAAIAITIATVGTGMPAIAGIIYGTFSAGAQIASNKKHGAETLKNVAGAFVGGFISGASLGIPVGQIVGGFINAGINEIENVMLHNPDNMPFSVIGMIYEGVIYSGANLAQSAIPIFPLQMGATFFIDYFAFDYSDTNKANDVQNIFDFLQALGEKIGDAVLA